MYKLLIADRDPNERAGISWLMTAYSLSLDKVIQASSVEQLIAQLELETPDIVCIELDMIPKENWKLVKDRIRKYTHKVIVSTTETTFERAMQAIELQAVELWVKPSSPLQIKNTLRQCLKSIEKNRVNNQVLINQSGLTYYSLFIDHETPTGGFHILLLQTENKKFTNELRLFLDGYDFQFTPSVFPLSDLVVCVFPNEQSSLYQVALRFLEDWEMEYEEPLAIVITEDFEQELSLSQKYLQAKYALELTFFKGYRQVISADSLSNWLSIDPFLTYEEQREWIDMLNKSDKDRLKSWLYKEFLNPQGPFPAPGLLRTRLTSILAQIRRFMQSYNFQQTELENRYHQVFEAVLNKPVLYRIVQEILLFTYEIVEEILNMQKKTNIDIIEDALVYMKQNFRESGLSLETVANKIDRSPAYFSHLLVKERGISFSKVLANLRIEESRKLLVNKTLSIQEIAEMSGFKNPNYFTRFFKKHTGMTPRAYRRMKS